MNRSDRSESEKKNRYDYLSYFSMRFRTADALSAVLDVYEFY